METKYLKKYAPEARRAFIEAVTNKAAVYGLLPDEILPMQEEGDVVIIGDRPFPRAVAKQRKELEERIRKEGFQQFIEAVAYTWFNRFVAIRYMELHGYLDHGYRVLSHPEGKSAPEILENAERVELPGLKRDEVVDLKLDGGKDEQLYQMLLLAQCNALHKAMPFLFESIKDGTELLLPDNLLHTDSLVRTLVNDISEEQWENVEIIGWLYQFYISEKKDEVIGKVVKSEDIPAATQLFTPNWIVRYMLHNTLGRKWLATYPDSPLREQMEFYIEPAGQTSEVQQQLDESTPDSLNPEELTLLDPACGSGHILVEAYDLFKAIYEERGYRARDIPQLILTKNLYGLEIDDRAAQLAGFALTMKARVDDRRVLTEEVCPNIVVFVETRDINVSELAESLASSLSHVASAADIQTLYQLFSHGRTVGSLQMIPPSIADLLEPIEYGIRERMPKADLFESQEHHFLTRLLEQASLLNRKFGAVVTNPPFISKSTMNGTLRSFAKEHYPVTRYDMFSMFSERALAFVRSGSDIGMVTPFVWLFISYYEGMRQLLFEQCHLTSLIQLEYNAFEPACVPVTTFTFRKGCSDDFLATYIRLSQFTGHQNQAPRTLEAIQSKNCPWRFTSSLTSMKVVPGCPVAYWVSDKVRKAFLTSTPLGDIATARAGMITGDNETFVRFWNEVSLDKLGLRLPSRNEAKASKKKWFPYDKGGPFRKWYGNKWYVVNWENDGHKLRTTTDAKGKVPAHAFNDDFIFKPNVNWSTITSSTFCVRASSEGSLFDSSGSAAFPEVDNLELVCGLLNSKVAQELMAAMNPTLHYQAGNVAALPWHNDDIKAVASEVKTLVRRAIQLAKCDWDSCEMSWDFSESPLMQDRKGFIEKSFLDWQEMCHNNIETMLRTENELNLVLLRAYNISDELSAEVPIEQITLYHPSREEDIRRLVSYAVGCMMGRYSLDESGLIYAHSENDGFDVSRYHTFTADEDGIVPITDMAWFPDDVANRLEQFVMTTWSEDHIEENLSFIAESLGKKKGETSRDCIRRYLATGFYKHHLSMYKKRPIYWLFSSGKQRAFQCIVYIHRYNAGTLSRIRTEYVVKLQGKINTRIEQLEDNIPAASSTSHRKKLEKDRDKLIKQREELQTFDEKLRHAADLRIELDLDDGVKVNYGKFGDLLAEVKTMTGKKAT